MAENGRDRLVAEARGSLGVHEGTMEVAHLAGIAPGRSLGGGRLLDDRPDPLAREIIELDEGAVVALVGRDRRVFEPRAVDVFIEIVLRADRLIESRHVDRAGGCGSSRRGRGRGRGRRSGFLRRRLGSGGRGLRLGRGLLRSLGRRRLLSGWLSRTRRGLGRTRRGFGRTRRGFIGVAHRLPGGGPFEHRRRDRHPRRRRRGFGSGRLIAGQRRLRHRRLGTPGEHPQESEAEDRRGGEVGSATREQPPRHPHPDTPLNPLLPTFVLPHHLGILFGGVADPPRGFPTTRLGPPGGTEPGNARHRGGV